MRGRNAKGASTKKRESSDSLQKIFSSFGTEGPRPEPRWKRLVSDQQWEELRRLSGLPPEARQRVAQSIIIYRNWSATPAALPPAQTRLQLEQTARQVDHLITTIDQLYDNGTAMDVITDREGWELVRIDNLFAELRSFAYLVIGAHGRVQQRANPGPGPNENLLGLVRTLACILHEEIGAKLSLSKKQHGPNKQNVAEFIIGAVHLADGKLNDQTILNAIRAVKEQRKLAQ